MNKEEKDKNKTPKKATADQSQITPVVKMIKGMDLLSQNKDIFDLKLTETCSITKEMLRHVAWQIIWELQNKKTKHGRPNTYHNVLATIFNSAIFHEAESFILSERTLEDLVKRDSNIKRKTMSGRDYEAVMAKSKSDGILIEISPPSKKGEKPYVAGIYRIGVQEIADYIAELRSVPPTSNLTSHKYKDEAKVKNKNEEEMANTKTPPSSSNFIASGESQKENTTDENRSSDMAFHTDRTLGADKYNFNYKGPLNENELNLYRSSFKNLVQVLSQKEGLKTVIESFSDMLAEHEIQIFGEKSGQLVGFRFPDNDFIENEIETLLKTRFTDSNGIWSYEGKICMKLRAELLQLDYFNSYFSFPWFLQWPLPIL